MTEDRIARAREALEAAYRYVREENAHARRLRNDEPTSRDAIDIALADMMNISEDNFKCALAALALPTGDAVDEQETSPCEVCGKPVLIGQFVHLYDDVGEVHVDCDHPYAIADHPLAQVLLGEPARLFPAAAIRKATA